MVYTQYTYWRVICSYQEFPKLFGMSRVAATHVQNAIISPQNDGAIATGNALIKLVDISYTGLDADVPGDISPTIFGWLLVAAFVVVTASVHVLLMSSWRMPCSCVKWDTKK